MEYGSQYQYRSRSSRRNNNVSSNANSNAFKITDIETYGNKNNNSNRSITQNRKRKKHIGLKLLLAICIFIVLVFFFENLSILLNIAGQSRNSLAPANYTSALSNADVEKIIIHKDEYRGKFPALMQDDPRWSEFSYCGDTMTVSGCGPTCLSAVIIHLTKETQWNPAAVAIYAEQNGYSVPGTGTAWALMEDGFSKEKIQSYEVPLNENSINQELRSGNPIICSMRTGDFTTGAGHFIILTSIDKNENYTVHDPAHPENNGKTWNYNELEPQIKNMWAFSKKSFL